VTDDLGVERLMFCIASARIETEAMNAHAKLIQRAYEIERERALAAESRCRELEHALSEALRAP
jgi:hypothetical protein